MDVEISKKKVVSTVKDDHFALDSGFWKIFRMFDIIPKWEK